MLINYMRFKNSNQLFLNTCFDLHFHDDHDQDCNFKVDMTFSHISK